MRSLPLIALLLAAAPVAAQEGECLDGMRWSAVEPRGPLAVYTSCTDGEVLAALACQDGAVRMTLAEDLPRSEVGAPVAVDMAVDGEIHTLAGNALPIRGEVRPYLTAGPDALAALIRGDRASFAMPDGTFDLHLTGSAAAIVPVREACAG
jgi:hypothetical protein